MKDKNNVQVHYWRLSDDLCEVDSEPCSSFDNVPVKTPKDAFLEFMANGQIEENRLRKVFYGEQFDCSDNMEYIDKFTEHQANVIARYRSMNSQATEEHNEILSEEKELNKKGENNAKKGE